MNTVNVTTNNIINAANIMKPSQTQPLIHAPSGIIPTTIITTNERLNNSTPNNSNNIAPPPPQNREPVTQSVTAFTIHAPTQSLQTMPNSLVGTVVGPVTAGTTGQAQIQTVNATSMIHPTIAITGTSVANSVVCTALPTGSGQQVTAFPVGVSGPSVLKAQPTMTTLPIVPRFQTTNVMASAGPSSGAPINLFIHSDHSKNQNVAAHSASNHHQTHIQQNSVMNTNVSIPGSAVTLQPLASTTPTPLFVQTANSTPNSAIFPDVTNLSHNSSQPTNLSTINVPTSTVQQSQTPSSASSQSSQNQFQRLKVEDALSYLDQVKLKFNDKPQVYNDFLDIMKEFKSQSIDTPGVIKRVSNLFQGHPELIVGFNTFLPPGYKIEIQADKVNVSMPNVGNLVLPNNLLQTHQQSVPTPAIVAGQNLHQVTGNIIRNTLVSNQNIPPNHGQTYLNSISSRDSSTPLTVPATNNSINQNRIETNHNHRSPNETNTRNTNIHLPNQNSIGQPGGPVEFNHAINYVNKIKNRFLDQPEIYKQFLDILQSYQKEQDNSGQKILTESEVFSKVSKLFENQPDLLQEFSQFLPDAHNSNSHSHNNLSSAHAGSNALNSNFAMQNSNQPTLNYNHTTGIENSNYTQQTNSLSNEHNSLKKSVSVINTNSSISNRTSATNNTSNSYPFHRSPKRSISNQNDQNNSQYVSVKRSKLSSSMSEGGKYMGDLVEYAFFDKLRSALNSSYKYDTFLRALLLMNNNILSRSELENFIAPIFENCNDLFKRFKELLAVKDGCLVNSVITPRYNLLNNSNSTYLGSSYMNMGNIDGMLNKNSLIDKLEYEELDISNYERYGHSYRAIPKTNAKSICSGRTQLCHEVLNDYYVSFPAWSEDSVFVHSRKTQYEEFVHRCEEERFELDFVIESNLSTIKVFESVLKKIELMTTEEKNNFKLGNSLGGNSEYIHINSVRRIYGENYYQIVEGIKENPLAVIPIVLRRLTAKNEEWREAKKHFNKLWREQNEKYYLKSLDHQSINFKQNDIKQLRTKSLINDIEAVVNARNNPPVPLSEDGGASPPRPVPYSITPEMRLTGPHMVFVYPDKSMIDIACNLIIHHVKRQTSIHKEDKRKIKQLMKHFVPDLYATPRGELSDDEIEEETENEKNILEQIKLEKDIEMETDEKPEIKTLELMNSNPDEEYLLFYTNTYWYCFFRLHYILCDRLSKMRKRAQNIASEEATRNKSSPAMLLGLQHQLDIKVEDYFSTLVDMIKQLLDGNLDSNQYEDTLREMFSIHAYIAFTLDKVVQLIVRQLQHIVSDEESQQCTELYLDAYKSGSAGGLCMTANQRAEDEANYYRNFEKINTDGNRFKIIIYKGEGKMTIDLLESIENSDDESGNEDNEDSNSNQANNSRTLRSSTKIMRIKEQKKIVEALQKNPPFLKKYIKMHKPFDFNEELSMNDDVSDKETENHKENNNDNDNSDNESVENKNATKVTECKFDPSSFSTLFIMPNYNSMYRRESLQKSKKYHKITTQRKHKKFSTLYADWIEKNLDETAIEKHHKWLLMNETTGFRLYDDNKAKKFEEKKLNLKKENKTAAVTSTSTKSVEEDENNNNNTDNNNNNNNNDNNNSNNHDNKDKDNSNNDKNDDNNNNDKNANDNANANSTSENNEKKPNPTNEKKNLQMKRLKVECQNVTPYRTFFRYLFQEC